MKNYTAPEIVLVKISQIDTLTLSYGELPSTGTDLPFEW